MNKTVLTSFTILCLLSTVFLMGLAFNVQVVKADLKTIYVDDDNTTGPWDGTEEHPYQNITSGLEHASAGDTLYVYNGTYYENVKINKTVTLMGENKNSTTIDGNSTGTVVQITANNVTITGFTIKKSGTPHLHGMYLDHSSDNNITNNIIEDNFFGILLLESGGNTFVSNKILNNQYGFHVSGYNFSHFNNYVDTSNTVDDRPIYYLIGETNAIYDAHANASTILLINCNNITVRDLNLTKNGYGVFLYNTTNTLVENITSSRNLNGITARNCRELIFSTNVISYNRYYYGIHLRYSNNNTLVDNTLLSNDKGIYVHRSTNNIVRGNTASGNGVGISLHEYADNNTIVDNNASSNGLEGFELVGSDYNIVTNNTAVGNSLGVILRYSTNNVFVYNNISRNYDGIEITGPYWGESQWLHSFGNLFSRNTVFSNTRTGIFLSLNSYNNTFINNEIANNEYGVDIYKSYNNKFYQNNFMENIQQVSIRTQSLNCWDDGYPLGGNYWSDFTDVDSDHDGIGDTPYIIDADNQDNYPLMGMFSDFNTSLGYYVNVISNSTIENFEYFESNSTIKMYVSKMTINQTFGFCRVCIPHTLMNVANISVIIDDGLIPVLYHNYTLYDNGTHRWIYFAYPHSIHEIDIIPESSSLIILPLFIIATLLAVILYRRKPKVKP